MAELLEPVVSWRTLVLVLLVYGFAPGLFLRMIVLAYPRSNARRDELVAELAAVPRLVRPLWVAEQLEIALCEGLRYRISAALRKLLRRRRTPAQVDDEVEDEYARRRRLLAHGVAVMFGTSMIGPPRDSPIPSQIGMAHVKQVEAVVRAMRALDYQFGGKACRNAMVAQLSWAQRLLSASCQEEVRQRLLHAVADLQSLTDADRPNNE